ncbi:DNA methyltransferase [Pullulanibacillus camelliae]|uniref:DNA methyltransferase n=1 Tax=Pullulanibacillus camelliae TaxID=1707096 RepID=A0A8J3DTB5_9BACL|nr:iron-sulfur cluster assembly protein [Pullulanibacillus camelliae]GGE43905.1 DNA methyltransferase [Pullulanibacillus camelliae]
MALVDNETVLQALKTVIDPELGINIVDLGLIYGIDVDFDRNVKVTMTLTTPGCPLHSSIESGVLGVLQKLDGIGRSDVDIVWEPRWSPENMSKDAKTALWGERPSAYH